MAYKCKTLTRKPSPPRKPQILYSNVYSNHYSLSAMNAHGSQPWESYNTMGEIILGRNTLNFRKCYTQLRDTH